MCDMPHDQTTKGNLIPDLPDALVLDLHKMNPWWMGKPGLQFPKTRRHLVEKIHRRLTSHLAPIILVRGPRQIGKTTAQLQVLEDFLARGHDPLRILRVQFDELPEFERMREPILRISDWFEHFILRQTLNEAAQAGKPALLFFDEVQNLRGWAEQLKHLVDHSTVQVVVTGSSALRMEQGRDSLAGRITTLEEGVLSLTEIATLRGIALGEPFLADNGLGVLADIGFWRSLATRGLQIKKERDQVFAWFSERGGYPLCHLNATTSWPQLADQLNETVIKRVILHDLRVGDKGRKRDEFLLEELFRECCRYVGQAPDIGTLVNHIRETLKGNLGHQRVRAYLKFLSDTLLIRLIQPLEIRLKKKRGNLKICLADHGLRASWLQEIVPLDPHQLATAPEHLSLLAGRIAESIVGATFSTIHGLDLSYFAERPTEPEVDFILTIGTRRIPVEVKYQLKSETRHAAGIRAFMAKPGNNASFGILITQVDKADVRDTNIVCLPLSTFMLLR